MSRLLEAVGLRLPGRLMETSISLDAGRLVCLVGPNGSGKTSLLHAIAGIGRPGGDVRIDGVDPTTLGPSQRQRLYSFLPALREVNWPLTVRDLVSLGLPDGMDRTAIDRAIETFGLRGLAHRRIDRLSTGERSRALISRALVARPRLLLLDEPASNLDPLWQMRLMDQLRATARANSQAVLVAVHDLDLARDHADRLIVMAGGRIEADGDTETVLRGRSIANVFGIRSVDGRWRPIEED